MIVEDRSTLESRGSEVVDDSSEGVDVRVRREYFRQSRVGALAYSALAEIGCQSSAKDICFVMEILCIKAPEWLSGYFMHLFGETIVVAWYFLRYFAPGAL